MRLWSKANPCSTVLVAPGGGLSREARAFDLAGTIHSVGPHAFALCAKGWAAVGIEFLWNQAYLLGRRLCRDLRYSLMAMILPWNGSTIICNVF
jgi:hypothetical protein